MPKIKTKKSASKRFSVTGSGKVKYKKQGSRHILTKKSTKRKKNLRKPAMLSPEEEKRIKKIMPYA